MSNARDLLRLSSIPLIGSQKIRALIGHFGDAAEVLRANPRELIKVPGIEKKIASNIAHHTDGESFADEQLKKLNKIGGRIISIWDPSYPELLKKIYDPPVLLFVLGDFDDNDKYSIAIVGTRRPSQYGQHIAEMLTRDLVKLNLTIVSGLARGVDTIAHMTTIKAGGRTIAVIGSGLDVPYPPENKALLDRIANEGVVISEFPMGTKPDAPNFPRRNRIISGLALGSVVVESAEDGGAMITATTALDQNREVFAVPGSITEKKSAGPNKLIREGRAKLIQGVDDILAELKVQLRSVLKQQKREPEPVVELTLFERKLVDVLGPDPVYIDTIAERAQVTTSDALVTLLSLEFKGLIKQLPGKLFTKLS